MRYTYRTKGVCASEISFDLDGDIVSNISFVGGCPGNHIGIARAVDGMTADEIYEKLSGIKCGFKFSSCPDQLAIAVKEAYENNN